MKKLFTLLFVIISLSGLSAQNIWDGSESTDFADTANWGGDQLFPTYAMCSIAGGDHPCVYNSNAKTFIVEMLDSGSLTVTNTFYVDKLYAYVGAEKSNIIIKDGGLVSVRNAASFVGRGNITVLDGGAFDCKSGISFIWGRWDSDSCFFNLSGGTANFSTFAPWRNGYINDAQIICKGGGVGTFKTASNITDWSAADKLVPAEGSLLTYDAVNSPTTLSSIDVDIPVSLDTIAIDGEFVMPNVFEAYATGDIDNASTITVVQTPIAGTVYNDGDKVTVYVTATDALNNVLNDSIEVKVGVPTPLNDKNEVQLKMYSSNGNLYINVNQLSLLQVYALSGAVVKNNVVAEGLSVLPLEKGIYIVSVQTGSKKTCQKISVE